MIPNQQTNIAVAPGSYLPAPPQPCPTCGRCPTCGHYKSAEPQINWYYPVTSGQASNNG